LRQAGWDATLDEVADRFAECIRTHGPDSVAFYVSGQLLTEEYYVFNKLAKGLVGTNNIDTNSRLCMSSAVTAYKATPWRRRAARVLRGHRPCRSHFHRRIEHRLGAPVLFRRIEAAKERNPALKVSRGRSAPHRDRDFRRPAPRDRAGDRRRALSRSCCT
jgi:assimilatory nitrate reductase catalytic subunit